MGDIWGIGGQYAAFLQKHGVRTAYDFIQAPDPWIRKHLTVVGLRIKKEIEGIPCIPFETVAEDKKTVGSTRTFKACLLTKVELSAALTDFTARCGEKIRAQGSSAAILTAYIQTDHFRMEAPQYSRSFPVTFTSPTNSTLLLVRAAQFALDRIYREGYQYKRAGIMLSGLVQQADVLPTLFDSIDHEKHQRLMLAMDQVNHRFGRNVVRTAGQTIGGVAKLTHQGSLSPAYTTRWKDLLPVRVGFKDHYWEPRRD